MQTLLLLVVFPESSHCLFGHFGAVKADYEKVEYGKLVLCEYAVVRLSLYTIPELSKLGLQEV